MKLPLDPKSASDHLDLLQEFAVQGAKYLVVGGVAAMAYGVRRTTKDIDLYVDADLENLRRVSAALRAFGAPAHLSGPEALRPQDGEILSGISFGIEPSRVDIMTRMPGLSFDEAYPRRGTAIAGGTIEVPVIARDDLITLKRAAGRPEDLADIRALERPPRPRKRGE